MARSPNIEFLDRGSYRHRRFRDAVRVLPLLATILMFLPLMWPRESPEEGLTSTGIIYLFSIWAGLVVAAALLARALRSKPDDEAPAIREPQEDEGT